MKNEQKLSNEYDKFAQYMIDNDDVFDNVTKTISHVVLNTLSNMCDESHERDDNEQYDDNEINNIINVVNSTRHHIEQNDNINIRQFTQITNENIVEMLIDCFVSCCDDDKTTHDYNELKNAFDHEQTQHEKSKQYASNQHDQIVTLTHERDDARNERDTLIQSNKLNDVEGETHQHKITIKQNEITNLKNMICDDLRENDEHDDFDINNINRICQQIDDAKTINEITHIMRNTIKYNNDDIDSMIACVIFHARE